MNYFKLIKNMIIIGVITADQFYTYQEKNNIFLTSSPAYGQYIRYNDICYRADWMTPTITDKILYETIEVVAIEEEEYNTLYQAIEKNEEILIEQPESEPSFEVETYTDPIEQTTIDFIRTSKLAEMSYNCNKTITNGFDIILSDGNTYHFSLTTQDQLNLITLATMVESGEIQIPYHADGEPCKFYSVEDINAIIKTATEFKTYHVSYYNSLKIYINSMETMEEISEVFYGIEIPAEYQSEVLKTIMKG